MDFPYFEFLSIIKEQRQLMINDILEGNSPDLYDALYSDIDSKISEIKLELYEIKWLQSYWNKVEDFIDGKEFSIQEKNDIVSKFSKWYEKFLKEWNYSLFDVAAFEERKKILKAMISANDSWDNNLKRMKVSFAKSIKLLEEKIREYEVE
jgi:hypothetical protein